MFVRTADSAKFANIVREALLPDSLLTLPPPPLPTLACFRMADRLIAGPPIVAVHVWPTPAKTCHRAIILPDVKVVQGGNNDVLSSDHRASWNPSLAPLVRFPLPSPPIPRMEWISTRRFARSRTWTRRVQLNPGLWRNALPSRYDCERRRLAAAAVSRRYRRVVNVVPERSCGN